MNATSNLAYWPMEDEWKSQSDTERASSARVIKVGDWNEWQINAAKKILSFQSLRQPNWDSYGSKAMTNSVIDTAIDFLNNIWVENVPDPYVIPVSGGAIQFEWTKGDRELEVEIRPDGSIMYLAVENGMPSTDEQPLKVITDAERWLFWLNGG